MKKPPRYIGAELIAAKTVNHSFNIRTVTVGIGILPIRGIGRKRLQPSWTVTTSGEFHPAPKNLANRYPNPIILKRAFFRI